jgi:voltage-gated potassium channel
MEPIRHAIIAFCLLFLVALVGTVGFIYIEGLTPLDAIYLTIATVTTVGYGDIVPETQTGKIFAAVLIIFGVSITLYVLVEIIASILEGRLSTAFGIARVKRGVSKLQKHKIICGGGRTGNVIAEEYRNDGLDFVVIEHDPDVIKELRKNDIPVVEGDATKENILMEAGVERASGLVSTLPSDCSNLLLSVTVKYINKNLELVVRASSEEAAKRLYSIGVKKVVIVEEIGGRRLAKSLIKPAVVDFLEFATATGEASLESIKVAHGAKIANKKVKDLRIKEKIGVTILALIRDRNVISRIGPEDEIQVGDTVVVLGNRESLDKLVELEFS